MKVYLEEFYQYSKPKVLNFINSSSLNSSVGPMSCIDLSFCTSHIKFTSSVKICKIGNPGEKRMSCLILRKRVTVTLPEFYRFWENFRYIWPLRYSLQKLWAAEGIEKEFQKQHIGSKCASSYLILKSRVVSISIYYNDRLSCMEMIHSFAKHFLFCRRRLQLIFCALSKRPWFNILRSNKHTFPNN